MGVFEGDAKEYWEIAYTAEFSSCHLLGNDLL